MTSEEIEKTSKVYDDNLIDHLITTLSLSKVALVYIKDNAPDTSIIYNKDKLAFPLKEYVISILNEIKILDDNFSEYSRQLEKEIFGDSNG